MSEQTDLDLRKRSEIILETSEIDKMNQKQLLQRRKEVFEKFNRIVAENNYDFMLDEPRKKGYAKAKEIFKKSISNFFNVIKK